MPRAAAGIRIGGDAGQGRIADGIERTIVARHTGGRGREIIAEKVNSWISSKKHYEKILLTVVLLVWWGAGVPAFLIAVTSRR